MSSGFQESLQNRVVVEEVRGKNRVTDMVYSSPFRIFHLDQENPADPVRLMFSNYGGGMLQGDRVHLDIRCKQNSALLLQSQANAQVFKNENHHDAVFRIKAVLESGSTVQVDPEPVVLHRDARFHQHQSWTLEKGAGLILVDWMQSGRSDSGESFLFQQYRSDLDIFLEGRQVVRERFRCDPRLDDPFSYAGFMGLSHMVNVFIIGKAALPPGLEEFRNGELKRVLLLEDRPADDPGRLHFSILPLRDQSGYVLRMLARSRLDLNRVLDRILQR